MPRLSLYRNNKTNDYRFLDKTVSEMLSVGGTDLYIHKYLGPEDQGASSDATQPQYDSTDPTNIQDLLFLENRDRKYDQNIYRLRGHYNVQNLDFDLSQFGLFLNNDTIFITVHYNDMIDIIGRKLMVGDVLELPHLLDYHPLDEDIPIALKRYYQITDANHASEGFSQTWYSHLWRIKCEPLVNSQEFKQILQQPINTDTYLGTWNSTQVYPPGYVITYGSTNYVSLVEVPAGVAPPDETYWQVDSTGDLKDILSTYNKNIAINDAVLQEAKRQVPLSGYSTDNLYVVPTFGTYTSNGVESGTLQDQPALPSNVLVSPIINQAPTVAMIKNPKYKNASPVIRITKESLKSIWNMTADMNGADQVIQDPLDKFIQTCLQVIEVAPERTDSGSGAVSGTKLLSLQTYGAVSGPYGTADNTYATADQDPEQPGFTGTISSVMDYRADADPRFNFIARSTPQSFGYLDGYLTGGEHIDTNLLGTSGALDIAPNGLPAGAGISFPQNPEVGDYFLRIDYLPQLLFRWNGSIWVRISANVRTELYYKDGSNKSQLSSFINNSNVTVSTSGATISQKQSLSKILKIDVDN